MFALSGEEPGALGGKEDMAVSPQSWISVVCLFSSSCLPTGRGNDLLVECNCVHAIPFVPTKNGGEGSWIHGLGALSAFSNPRIVSFPDDMQEPPRPPTLLFPPSQTHTLWLWQQIRVSEGEPVACLAISRKHAEAEEEQKGCAHLGSFRLLDLDFEKKLMCKGSGRMPNAGTRILSSEQGCLPWRILSQVKSSGAIHSFLLGEYGHLSFGFLRFCWATMVECSDFFLPSQTEIWGITIPNGHRVLPSV